jgi:hypothetical protein
VGAKHKRRIKKKTYHIVATGRDGRDVEDGVDVGAVGVVVGVVPDGEVDDGGTVALGFVPNGTERKISS